MLVPVPPRIGVENVARFDFPNMLANKVIFLVYEWNGHHSENLVGGRESSWLGTQVRAEWGCCGK